VSKNKIGHHHRPPEALYRTSFFALARLRWVNKRYLARKTMLCVGQNPFHYIPKGAWRESVQVVRSFWKQTVTIVYDSRCVRACASRLWMLEKSCNESCHPAHSGQVTWGTSHGSLDWGGAKPGRGFHKGHSLANPYNQVCVNVRERSRAGMFPGRGENGPGRGYFQGQDTSRRNNVLRAGAFWRLGRWGEFVNSLQMWAQELATRALLMLLASNNTQRF